MQLNNNAKFYKTNAQRFKKGIERQGKGSSKRFENQ